MIKGVRARMIYSIDAAKGDWKGIEDEDAVKVLILLSRPV